MGYIWRPPSLVNVEILLKRKGQYQTASKIFGYHYGKKTLRKIALGGWGNEQLSLRIIHYFGKIPNILVMVVDECESMFGAPVT